MTRSIAKKALGATLLGLLLISVTGCHALKNRDRNDYYRYGRYDRYHDWRHDRDRYRDYDRHRYDRYRD